MLFVREIDIMYIISFKVYCQLLQNDAQHLLVYRYPSQFHGQIACALSFIPWMKYWIYRSDLSVAHLHSHQYFAF